MHDDNNEDVRRLREERDLFRTASKAAELRIVELREQVWALEQRIGALDAEVAALRSRARS